MAFHLRAIAFVCLAVFGCDKAVDDENGDGETETGETETGETETGETETGETGDEPSETENYVAGIETSLGPDMPLRFVIDVDNWTSTDSGATADLTFHPLQLDPDDETQGECIGDPLVYVGVAFDADGNFELDMGLVTVPGAANPDAGSDIEATIVLTGHPAEPDAMCGDVEGMLMSPLEYDLAGSTFAAIPLVGGCEAELFPSPIPYECSML